MKKSFVISFIFIVLIVFISVVYNVVPRLQLSGVKNMVLSYRDDYVEPGVILKNATGNYMSKLKVDSNLVNGVVGSYYVDYSLKMGHRNLSVRRNVKVIDDVSPVIKLKGSQIVLLSINESYKELGFSAMDEYDGDLTLDVNVIGSVDSSKYGEYVLSYEVADSSNNVTRVNRIVKVVDEVKPVFNCDGNYSVFKVGDNFPVGCKAIDNYDGDITSKVRISGDYDINKPGIYKVHYSVSDDANNEAFIAHNIVVYDERENLTLDILKVLKDTNVVATFFVDYGVFFDNSILGSISDGNFEIGLLGDYSSKDKFILHASRLKGLINKDVNVFRFLGGSLKADGFKQVSKYLNENGIKYYDWNVDSTDLDSKTSDEVVVNILNKIISSDDNSFTILFHDESSNRDVVLNSLREVIGLLKDMGGNFDVVSRSVPVQFRK